MDNYNDCVLCCANKLIGSDVVFFCKFCLNYFILHHCNTKQKVFNLIHSRFCSGCGVDISSNPDCFPLIKPDDNLLPKFSFSNSSNTGSLELFVLNKKPLIRFNNDSLFFFENNNFGSDNNKIIVLKNDIIIVDRIFLLIIKKNVCEVLSFFSRDHVSHPKIFLENLLPIKPEFRFIFGEGYLFWMSNIEGMGYLNCSQISNGKSTKILLDKVDIINKKDCKIFFPDGCFQYNSFKVFIQTSDSVIKILCMIINYKVELSVDDVYFNNDQVRLKYISFSGQKTFLCVFQNANVLIKDTTNSNFQIQSYSEDKIFNSLDKNLYIQHGIYIRIFPWVDNVSDKLKEIPTNTNYNISFCAYLVKSDVLFLIYRKPQKFDICIVKKFGLHKWLYDIESSSAQLLLIDNLLYFFLVNDNHKEISVKILDLNDYIS